MDDFNDLLCPHNWDDKEVKIPDLDEYDESLGYEEA